MTEYISKVQDEDTGKIAYFKDSKAREDIEALNSQFKDIAKKIEGGNIGNNVEPMYGDIPKMFITGNDWSKMTTAKNEVGLNFEIISKTNKFKGGVKTKYQGNSSLNKPKHNLTCKLYKDTTFAEKLKIDFKGWGKQSKFVAKANWIDHSHARNNVSALLWGDCVRSRADFENYPELYKTSPNVGAIDGFPIKLYANGIYQGLYTLNIPKDKWMANMDDSLDAHCILCGENYESGCFRATANINGNDWTDEIHDVVPVAIKTRWNEIISFVMNSTDAEFKENLHNYFYVDSLIDYIIFGLVSCGLDAFGKNQLYLTYDGKKFIAGLYDADSTWGLYWNGESFVATDYSREQFEDYKNTNNQGNLLYVRLLKLFINEIKARYKELRQGALSSTNIINRFERFTDVISSDLYKEDYASTTGEGKFTGIPLKDTNNIQQIRNYTASRLTYMDSYINSLVEPVSCTAISLDKTTLSFTSKDTQTLTVTLTPTNTTDTITWSTAPTGICTVDNGVVTPIKNGSCVITVTCGNQTATCNITVNLPSVACTSITLNKTELHLGTIQGTQPDTDANLIEGLTWKDGTLDENTGAIKTGTDKYIANIPIPATGLYTLSATVNYTYLKMFIYNSNNQLLHCDTNKNTGALSLYVYEPNCHISISVFPNSLEFDANNVSLKYVHNLANTPNKDIDFQASTIANMNLLTTYGEYDIIELYADDEYTDIASLKLGNTIYKIYNFTNQSLTRAQGDVSVARANTGYCTKGSWNEKTFFNIAVPSTWGATKEDIVNYIQTNNIAIVMNPSEYLNSADKTENMTLNNYQLIPTIEPSNCTDSVVWSTSPGGIVTVDNGLVQVVANGETIVTATCGTKSDTCNVTVS